MLLRYDACLGYQLSLTREFNSLTFTLYMVAYEEK